MGIDIFKISNYLPILNSSKKLGEHVFEMYAMLHETIPHTQVYYQTKPSFFTVEVYKRTSMDSRSFSEHIRKCENRGENKVITVHQGGILSELESFSILYVLHDHLSQLGNYVTCSVQVTLRYQVPFFNKSLF
jgi:hypothetical protein